MKKYIIIGIISLGVGLILFVLGINMSNIIIAIFGTAGSILMTKNKIDSDNKNIKMKIEEIKNAENKNYNSDDEFYNVIVESNKLSRDRNNKK